GRARGGRGLGALLLLAPPPRRGGAPGVLADSAKGCRGSHSLRGGGRGPEAGRTAPGLRREGREGWGSRPGRSAPGRARGTAPSVCRPRGARVGPGRSGKLPDPPDGAGKPVFVASWLLTQEPAAGGARNRPAPSSCAGVQPGCGEPHPVSVSEPPCCRPAEAQREAQGPRAGRKSAKSRPDPESKNQKRESPVP
ncbi:unnamed protein product, partial [Gulo gulo]